MKIETRGIELEVKGPNGSTHLGDLVVTKSKLIWCKGRTSRENGKSITWKKFIEMMEEYKTIEVTKVTPRQKNGKKKTDPRSVVISGVTFGHTISIP